MSRNFRLLPLVYLIVGHYRQRLEQPELHLNIPYSYSIRTNSNGQCTGFSAAPFSLLFFLWDVARDQLRSPPSISMQWSRRSGQTLRPDSPIIDDIFPRKLCNRTFGNVSYIGAHDSYAVSAGSCMFLSYPTITNLRAFQKTLPTKIII